MAVDIEEIQGAELAPESRHGTHESEASGADAVGHALDVTSGTIWKQLLQLALPVFIGTFFQQAYQLINTWVLGRFATTAALGGIQAAGGINQLAVGFCIGVGTGCAIVCGQYFGARSYDKLADSIHTAITLALAGGLLVSLGSVLIAGPILRVMGTPDELLAEATVYSRFYLGALVFNLVYNMGAAILRAIGDTRTPALILAASCVVAALLDLLFVAGFHMEAAGCGLSNMLSLAAAALVTCWIMTRAHGSWRLHPSRLLPASVLDSARPVGTRGYDSAIAATMLRTGVPLGVQSSAYSISDIIVQTSMNSFGADVVTGWGLAGRIDSIIWMVAEALGIATTTFSAQNFGAKNYERMHRALRSSIVLAFVLVGGLSAIIISLIEPISRFFVKDPAVLSTAILIVHTIGPFYFLYSISENISGCIRGSGESFRPMLITLVGTCILRIAWVLIAVGIRHEQTVLMAAYPITWGATDIIFILYYFFGHWLKTADSSGTAVQ